jgi:hypothetical protein
MEWCDAHLDFFWLCVDGFGSADGRARHRAEYHLSDAGPFNGQYFHSGYRPYFVPFSTGVIDDDGTDAVQFNPVKTAPFAPPAAPTANDRAPAAPYKSPSVEIAPGGVEIVRGQG